MSKNVFVCARVRPPLKDEDPNDTCVQINEADRTIAVRDRQGFATDKQYSFSAVFPQKASQRHIFESVGRTAVETAFEGHHSAIIAYGQTNSGKTYTLANKGSTDKEDGLLQRCVKELFETVNKNPGLYRVTMSYTQIYNEVLSDLLTGEAPTSKTVSLTIREDAEGNVFVPGLTTVDVCSAGDVTHYVDCGNKIRMVALTNMNAESSRSHVVVTLHLHRTNTASAAPEGRLLLVDLAGSERIKKSRVQGVRKQEAQCINASLACLGNVVHALAEGSPHVPYRDCKITRLLQDAFKRGRTNLVVTVGPSSSDFHETNSTLTFGMRAMKIKQLPMGRGSTDAPFEEGVDTSLCASTASAAEFSRLQSGNEEMAARLREEDDLIQHLGAALREADDEIRVLHREIAVSKAEAMDAAEAARNQLLLHQDVVKQLLRDRERDHTELEALKKHLQQLTAERDGLLEAIQLDQITKTTRSHTKTDGVSAAFVNKENAPPRPSPNQKKNSHPMASKAPLGPIVNLSLNSRNSPLQFIEL